MTLRLSVLGQQVDPIAPAVTDPRCTWAREPASGAGDASPAMAGPGAGGDDQWCGGEMVPTNQTMTIPLGGGTLALLRCARCRESRWYKLVQAYALMPEIEP